MNQPKLTPDDVNWGSVPFEKRVVQTIQRAVESHLDWRSVTFKECGTHKGLLFACERCPVCVIIEDRDLALGVADEAKTQLEGRIADLEEQVDGYRSELRL